MLAERALLANQRLSAIKKTVRSIFTLVAIAAWFCLSNHCALGLALPARELAAQAETSGCPMHSSPAKNKPATKTPCCKDIRAVIAKCVCANPAALRLIGSRDYATEILARPTHASLEIESLDTGPPRCFSFAESVLQKSMLAHAPPVS